MKREFAVGDRVSFYAFWTNKGILEKKGVVQSIGSFGQLEIVLDDLPGLLPAHPKQCRHLKKKPARKAREWWIITDGPRSDHGIFLHEQPISPGFQNQVHVREVLPTKKLRPITGEMLEKAWRLSPTNEDNTWVGGFIKELEKISGRRFR